MAAPLSTEDLQLYVAARNAQNTGRLLETTRNWHKLILTTIMIILLQMIGTTLAVKSAFQDFVDVYNESIQFGRTYGMPALVSLPKAGESGRNVAMAAMYPWFNKFVFGDNNYAKSCLTAFYSIKFGPCVRQGPNYGALYFGSIWAECFEGRRNDEGGGYSTTAQVVCNAFYKCAKVECAPDCRAYTVGSVQEAVVIPALQGGLGMGMSAGFLGSMAGGPAGVAAAAAGLIVGGALGAWEGSLRHEDDIQRCNYNKEYTNCYLPPGEEVCGEVCREGEGPCTETKCSTVLRTDGKPVTSLAAVVCDTYESSTLVGNACAVRSYLMPPQYTAGCTTTELQTLRKRAAADAKNVLAFR